MAVFFAGSSTAADSSLYTLESGLSELIHNISRSVVTVEASKTVPGDMLEGVADEAVQRLISSGTIVDSAGHIVVAAATVAGYDRIVVKYEDYQLPARVIGIDYHTGLALLSVDRRLGVPARFTERHACVGQMIVAIGNAYGLRACPTLGFCAGSRPDGSLQFSAAITPGTIGGGVFDLTGQFLGMVIGGVGQGNLAETGLAIPAHRLPVAINHLITQGDRVAGYIGITTTDIEISPGLELVPPNRLASSGAQQTLVIERGTIVTEVIANSPASRSGLRKGDLLFSIDNRSVTSAFDLMSQVSHSLPGGAIELGFIRHNQPYLTKLLVGRRELAPVGDFASGELTGGVREPTKDSLYREVQNLKRSLRQLEERVKRVGP